MAALQIGQRFEQERADSIFAITLADSGWRDIGVLR
jgi:hypothetical protein